MHNSPSAFGGDAIRLSSRLTKFVVRILPACFLALVGILIVGAAIAGRDIASLLLLLPLLGVYLLIRSEASNFADEVFDCGDSLVVRKGTVEDRIPLQDIGSVRASRFSNPERITLQLSRHCKFGREVAFIPVARWHPFARHPVARELNVRINRAIRHETRG